MGAAVVMIVFAIWYLATHGKGDVSSRLIAWMLAPLVLWVLISVHSPSAGARIADWSAGGVSKAVTGISQFASDVFG